MRWRSPHDRDIFRFVLPALGTLAADPLVSLVDTAFVGRLGTEALGALGVNAGIFAMAFFLFNFLAYGTTPMVASRVGMGRRAEAGRIVVAAGILAVGLGLAGTAALLVFASPIATLMGATDALAPPTLAYLRARAWAMPAVLLVTVGHGAFRGYQDTRTPLWLTVALNLVNLVLDPVLIFGLGWGVTGAACATVIAQWVGAVGFVAMLVARRDALGIPFGWPGLGPLRRLLGVGSVLSVRTFALIFTLTVATAVATRMGDAVIAAHEIARQLWLMFALFIDAFALAGQALIADHLGAGRTATARAIADRLVVWGVATGVFLGGFVWAAAPVWPWFFDLEPEVADRFAAVLPIVAVMQPLDAVVFVWDGVFMGAKRFGYLAWTMVVAATVTLGALAVVWTMHLGLVGVWGAIVLLIALRGGFQAAAYWPRGRLFRRG